MIKTKKCELCNNNAFSKGFCKNHQPKGKFAFSSKKPIKQARECTKEKTAQKHEKRKVYFEYHINKILENDISCQECGYKLNGDRSEIAHIISKSKNPEVENIIDNIIYLCGVSSFNQCHSKFDQSLDKRKTMTVFKIALNKFTKFKHLILNHTKEVDFFEKNL